MGRPRWNAVAWLLDRRIEAGGGGRLALTGPSGDVTYGELSERVQRTAGALGRAGLQPEQRVMMFMADRPEFVVVFLAAMRIGAIPVPVSTMTHAGGLAGLLDDSRATMLAVTEEFSSVAADATNATEISRPVLLDPQRLAEMATSPSPALEPYPTTPDSPAFWLYTSGTTGEPKAAMHRHWSIKAVCESYAVQVLGITAEDRCLSVAKAFFAYGLGNSVLLPLSAGAASILEPDRPAPDSIAEAARKFGATLFMAGPTFFANMLRAGLRGDSLGAVRLATSAGEALPAALYERWTSHFGVDIIDGLGMTETLHIFCSNRAGAVRPGTSGTAVPGYDLRIIDEEGRDVEVGVPGTLLVRGESAATGYWSRYDASRTVFCGEWMRTGDTYVRDADGYYTCLGRTNDMLKASGMWVSPAEVEGALLAHPAVAQAVVVAGTDPDGLEKPVAYVVPQAGATADEDELVAHCRELLPSFKRPRRVVFVDTYPTTATGKVRRVELRALATEVLGGGCD